MKKIVLFLGFLMLICAGLFAQNEASFKSQYGNTTDTATNTTAKRLTIQNGAALTQSALPGWYKTVAVQFYATEISGTTAGTAALQGSLDGTNWFTIGSAFTLTDVASQNTNFLVADWPYKYLSVLVTPTGTMSDIISAKYVARKAQ